MANPTPLLLNTQVDDVFNSYPNAMKKPLLLLRQLIFEVAREQDISAIEETMKWGEPSYLCPQGSTIRLAWRKSSPKHDGIFFNCKTPLVETFREIYPTLFTFEGNRAIIFQPHDHVPNSALKHCITIALRYHKIKHLPLLGAS